MLRPKKLPLLSGLNLLKVQKSEVLHAMKACEVNARYAANAVNDQVQQ
jgi:hypothetical protein